MLAPLPTPVIFTVIKKIYIYYHKTLKLTTTFIVVSPKSKCESSPAEEAIPLPTHTSLIQILKFKTHLLRCGDNLTIPSPLYGGEVIEEKWANGLLKAVTFFAKSDEFFSLFSLCKSNGTKRLFSSRNFAAISGISIAAAKTPVA